MANKQNTRFEVLIDGRHATESETAAVLGKIAASEPREQPAPRPLYDVVVYAFEDRKVQSITGRDLEMSTGFHNAEKRLDTTFGRINLEAYCAAIVPAGTVNIGDVLPE